MFYCPTDAPIHRRLTRERVDQRERDELRSRASKLAISCDLALIASRPIEHRKSSIEDLPTRCGHCGNTYSTNPPCCPITVGVEPRASFTTIAGQRVPIENRAGRILHVR